MNKRAKLALIGACFGAATVAIVAASAGVAALFARGVVSPARRPDEPVRVDRVEQRGVNAIAWIRGEDVSLPGQYSLLFDGGSGHARLDEVVETRGRSVGRVVHTVDRGKLREGARGRITGWWYVTPEELGLRSERITYPTELGDAEAWIVLPRRIKKKRWAVHVHGRGARPEEALRGAAPLARAGVASLIISYRNDPGAPAGERGRYGIGLPESRDVDAAVSEVLRRGAERVTLVGWSMGGTAALVSATSGAHINRIDGLILDSPAVDWAALLRHQAGSRGLPALVAEASMALLSRDVVRGGQSGGISFENLSPEAFAAGLHVPVMIHASTRDTFVPSEGAERLAILRPDLVRLYLTEVGEHVKIWNVDPTAWEDATEQFAAALPGPAWRG